MPCRCRAAAAGVPVQRRPVRRRHRPPLAGLAFEALLRRSPTTAPRDARFGQPAAAGRRRAPRCCWRRCSRHRRSTTRATAACTSCSRRRSRPHARARRGAFDGTALTLRRTRCPRQPHRAPAARVAACVAATLRRAALDRGLDMLVGAAGDAQVRRRLRAAGSGVPARAPGLHGSATPAWRRC